MHGTYDAPDGPDVVAAPSDFPTDPVFYHDGPLLVLLAWGIVMALVIWGVYRIVRRNQWEGFFAHVKTVKLVEAASRQAQARAYEASGTPSVARRASVARKYAKNTASSKKP